MNTSLTIPVSDKFIRIRESKAMQYNNLEFAEEITDEMRMRADCELYEWHMTYINEWGPWEPWTADGVSDKYGVVDVKMVEKWWNISCTSMRNICRQYNIVEHWYFLEKTDWPKRPLKAGDEVTVNFLGVLTFEEVMKYIQVSFGNGFYLNVRKFAHG